MESQAALNIGLFMLFLTGLLLWLDSPKGTYDDSDEYEECGIRGCTRHRR